MMMIIDDDLSFNQFFFVIKSPFSEPLKVYAHQYVDVVTRAISL
jgi:hypothetical protein